jgi:hypothetical protein
LTAAPDFYGTVSVMFSECDGALAPDAVTVIV